MAYPYYNNNQFYMQDLQNMREKIDRQMQQMQQLNQQQQQPTPTNLTQNFSIAPTQNNTSELEAKYVNNIDEVKNTFVMKTGVFINKDFTTLWIKNTNGDIKTYTLEEVIETDPRDAEILMLKRQIEEMKGMINNEQSVNTDDVAEVTTKKSNGVQRSKSSNAK